MKRCRTCGINKKNSEFYKDPSNKKNGLKLDCKVCYCKNVEEYDYKTNYGLTKQQKEHMVKAQNNCCAICGDQFVSTLHTHVDHCHTTKKLRDILCSHCNRGLGCFKDSTDKLKLAINYLEHHAQTQTAAPVPAGNYREGEIYPELGTFSSTGFGEDHYDLDHYCRTVSGEDLDYCTQKSGGDGVGYRDKKVGTFVTSYDIQNHGEPSPADGKFIAAGGHLPDQS